MPTFPPRYRRAARPKKDLRYWRNPNQIFHIKKVDEQTHSRLDGSSEWRIEQRRLNPKTTGALGLKVKAERESKEISGTASQLFDP
ncbi:hypothetical protein KKE06_00530, partial [Candidatus Micrarchaeota archaeon]|nr:hypothetical protein [Candidatus Micrarchaeota archaeon]MBU1930586.1 hypothetical protein [Candidatus Micrarchaeota archaeon]